MTSSGQTVDKIVLNLKFWVILTGILLPEVACFNFESSVIFWKDGLGFPLVVEKKEGRWDVVTLQGLGFPVTNKCGAVIELAFTSLLIWNKEGTLVELETAVELGISV